MTTDDQPLDYAQRQESPSETRLNQLIKTISDEQSRRATQLDAKAAETLSVASEVRELRRDLALFGDRLWAELRAVRDATTNLA